MPLICLRGVFTYPTNVMSKNWTTMPEPFEAAREQWEFSHAASSVLTFLALLAVSAAVASDVVPTDMSVKQAQWRALAG